MKLHHHKKKEQLQKHSRKLFILFVINAALAFIWGPTFITLTIVGVTRQLSSQVVWVAMISYYANMMGNIATAAAIWASITSAKAHQDSIDTSAILEDHIESTT